MAVHMKQYKLLRNSVHGFGKSAQCSFNFFCIMNAVLPEVKKHSQTLLLQVTQDHY